MKDVDNKSKRGADIDAEGKIPLFVKSFSSDSVLPGHLREAYAFVSHAREMGFVVSHAAVYGSAVDGDLTKLGDLDMLVLADAKPDAECMRVFADCYCRHIERTGEASLFSHTPVVALLGGPCFFGVTPALGLLSRSAVITGDALTPKNTLIRHVNICDDPLLSACYWELADICGDLISTVAESKAEQYRHLDDPRFWPRINRRLVDLAFYGMRLAVFLRNRQWVTHNRAIIDIACRDLGWCWHEDYKSAIRSGKAFCESTFPEATFTVLASELQERYRQVTRRG